MEFAGFLGNAQLKQRLAAAFQAGKISHCYLLCGPEGSGKHTLARILSAALQCEEAEVPCGRCAACRKALSGIHPDVITIDDPEKKTVSVDLVRRLQADAWIRPNEGRRKVYLIPRAQDLTDNGQNALLKLLEEPPSYAVFLLLTDNAQRLLPTVRSRCAELRLEPVSQAEALPWLQSQSPQADRQALLAAFQRSGGYLGQARTLLQGELYQPLTLQFAEALASGDRFAMAQVLCAMEKLPRDKLLALLTQWRQLLADGLCVRSGLPGGPTARTLGERCTGPTLAAAARAVRSAMDHCSANVGAGHICGWLATQL